MGSHCCPAINCCISLIEFFVKQEPANETEKQLIDITGSYKADLGMGFQRTFSELFTAVSLCLLSAYLGLLSTGILKRKTWQQIYGKVYCSSRYLFFRSYVCNHAFVCLFPPILCTGLIFLSVTASYLTVKK